MDMNCPRCGKPLGAGATFCMHCGQMLAAAPSPNAPMTPVIPAAALPGQPSRARTMLAGAALTVLVLAAVAWGLNSAGVLRLGGGGSPGDSLRQAGEGQGGNSLMAPGDGGSGSMLEAQGNSDPGAMLPSQAERARMPQDVYDWLEHLRRCCEKYEEINASQLDAFRPLASILDVKRRDPSSLLREDESGSESPEARLDVEPLIELAKHFDSATPKWRGLVNRFNERKPPAECQAIAIDFDQALTNIYAEVSDLAESLREPGGYETKLPAFMALLGKSTSSIDDAFDRADEGVSAICEKYEVRKWFKVRSQRTMPSLTGLGIPGF